MNRPFHLLPLLLSLSAGALANDASNPYLVIAQRNAFNLRPPPVINVPPLKAVAPGTEIKLQGVISFPPKSWAVVSVKEAGGPEFFVTLKEGEEHPTLKLRAIDPVAGQVTLLNAGVEWILTLNSSRVNSDSRPAPKPRPVDEHKPVPTTPPVNAGDP